MNTTNPFTLWLHTPVFHLGALAVDPALLLVLAMAVIALACFTPTALVFNAWLRRRRVERAMLRRSPQDITSSGYATGYAYAGGGYGYGYMPFAGARWAGRSAWAGVKTVAHISGLVFRITLIAALLSIGLHLSLYAGHRLEDIYQYRSLNPPVQRNLPADYLQLQSEARDGLRYPAKAAKEHKELWHELVFEWIL